MEQEITFDATKLSIVDIDAVRPNTWNPKDKGTDDYKKVVESVRINKFRDYIIVRENNGFEIIDGEQRWTACKELGYKKILIYNEGVVDDKRAKELTLWYQVQAPTNDVMLAKMIAQLVGDFPDSTIPYTPMEIEEMKNLAKFDWDTYKIDNTPPMDVNITSKTLVVSMTDEQYEMLQNAITKIKKEAGQDITDGRALELMAGDYLAGFGAKEA